MRLNPADLRNFPGRSGVPTEIAYPAWRICSFLNSAVPFAPPILFSPGEDALGRRVWTDFEGEGRWTTIVGVLGDTRNEALGTAPRPQLYRPHVQVSTLGMALVVRTRGEPLGLARGVREALWALDRTCRWTGSARWSRWLGGPSPCRGWCSRSWCSSRCSRWCWGPWGSTG